MNTIRLNILGEAKAASSGVSIKNQDKSVDIVENGVTEVTADSGYTGLGKVTINANVQGGASGGSVNMMYMDVSSFTGSQGQQMKKMIVIFATDAVYDALEDGNLWYGPAAYARPSVDNVERAEDLKRLSFNLSQKLHMLADFENCATVGDALAMMGVTPDSPNMASYLMTEEEFYTL